MALVPRSFSAPHVVAMCRVQVSGPPQQQGAMFVKVVVEVPQWSFVKRKGDGSVDFIAPIPCPFNYGSVPDLPAADGDPLDALVLGKQLPYGHAGVWRVRGVVKFMDDGVVDNKLVCTQHRPPTNHAPSTFTRSTHSLHVLDFVALSAFFTTYAVFKTALNAARGKFGRTGFDGLDFSESNISALLSSSQS